MPPKKRARAQSQSPPSSSSTSEASSSPGGEEGAKKAKKAKTAKLGKSLVHEEFLQSFTEDENGIKKWISKCKICQDELNDKQASHLKDHLSAKHPKIFKLVKDKEFELKKKMEKESNTQDTKQTKAVDAFLNLLINSGLPLSLADNKYFHDLIKILDPDIKMPKRKGITTLLVEGKFLKMYMDMLSLLQRVDRVHITLDMWSNSNVRSSFLGITGHVYDPKTRKKVNFRLALRPFNESHTAQAIKEKCIEIFEEFGILDKVSFMNSDNGANVKKGLLTLTELAITVSQEPLVVPKEGDDWAQHAINQVRAETETSSQAQDSAPNMNPIEDLFLPGALEEPDWDVNFEEEVTQQYIQKLEDEFVSLMTNPRTSTMRRIACWCHTLQLPILRMFDKKEGVFKNVLDAVQAIVARFSRSLAPKVQLHELVGLAIIRHCPTRWWTKLAMMARIQDIGTINKEALNTIIRTCQWKKQALFHEAEYELISLFVAFFTYMKEKSDQLAGENMCTIHLVHSVVKGILKHIRKWTSHSILGSFAKEFETEFCRYFDHMVDPTNANFEPIYIVSAFLSPFHQNFLTDEEKKLAADYLKVEVAAFEHSSGDLLPSGPAETTTRTTDPVPDPTLPGMDLLMDLIGSGQVQNGTADNVTDLDARFYSDLEILKKDSDATIQKYLRTGKMEDQDILKYWERMSYLCGSKLAEAACNILVIPSSSVPSERLFSIAGLMSSGRQHNISAKNLECRVLLRCNGNVFD